MSPGEAEAEGSITVLTIGLTAVVLMVLAGLSQAAHLFLQQRSLAAVCDGAAVAAVQAVDPGGLYESGAAQVDPAGARADLARWLAAPGTTTDAPGVDVVLTGFSADRRGLSVTCRRRVSVPFSGVVGIGPTTLVAHAAARLP